MVRPDNISSSRRTFASASSYFDIGQREIEIWKKLDTEGHLSSDEWIIFALQGRWGFYLSQDKLNEKQKKIIISRIKKTFRNIVVSNF